MGIIMSHGGKARINNEDNGYLDGYYRLDDKEFIWSSEKETENHFLAAVFDGMGGEEHGEVASRIAARMMYAMKNKKFSEVIEEYVAKSSESILSYAKNTNMGTTYAAVSIEENKYYFSNLGDSRGYLFRNGTLRQMTKDHNMVQEFLRAGILTEEQAKVHPERHTVYQFLGMKDEEDIPLEPYQQEPTEVQVGDICLLCSDGLTDMLKDDEICDILIKERTIKDSADNLLQSALKQGGKDNVTILLLTAK